MGGKVANGEAHRQEVGVISSGSYQSHFLYDLSDEKRDKRESKTKRRTVKQSDKSWKNKCFRKKYYHIKETSRHTLSKLTREPEKEVTRTAWTKPTDDKNEEQSAHEKSVNRRGWPKMFF